MSTNSLTHQVIRASAGTGKTFRLTNRYIALLAQDVPPPHIWAATFTRKAAGEILDRVLERLIEAADGPDKAKELAAHIGRPECASPVFAEHLRVLLSNLHQLRIGTLDSLFLYLAGTFPLELGLPAGWAICDEADSQADYESALDAVLTSDPTQLKVLVALFERLTQGKAQRGIRSSLMERVLELLQAFHSIERKGWHTQPPKSPSESLDDLLNEIESFDLGTDKRMTAARNEDVKRARSNLWEDVVGKGLCAKVIAGEKSYYTKTIPPKLVNLYKKLKGFAADALLKCYFEETAAAWELLDQFNRHLAARQKSNGNLRFEDVTRVLARGLERLATGFDYRIDGRIGHLLLDEFQDTSTSQWGVVRPLADTAMKSGTFFGVGDIKQAIYGWRGGRAALLERLPKDLGITDVCDLDQSRRSAQSIVEVVNLIFGGLTKLVEREEAGAVAQVWQKRFLTHSTARSHVPGYCHVETGLKRDDDESVADYRARHYKWVAKKIQGLLGEKPTATVGVLCRKNDSVGRLIFELRKLGVPASEEGGNPITDSPAVDVILSMFTLADHPGNSIAAFHLNHCPLTRQLIESGLDPSRPPDFALQVRKQLLDTGYQSFVAKWAETLADVCEVSDRVRLDQLVVIAETYQPRATLRTTDFVAWVQEKSVASPSSSRVRVLTVHKAKGLEFDAVVLPELDVPLAARPVAYVVTDPDPSVLPYGFVGRRVSSTLRQLADKKTIEQCAAADRRGIEESLCLLYVALTRARDGLYLFPPGPYATRKRTNEWDTIVLKALCPVSADTKERDEKAVVYTAGDSKWQPEREHSPSSASVADERTIRFATSHSKSYQSEWVSPSHLEGGRRIRVARMFDSQATGRPIGVLYHSWFAAIEWLDQKAPADEELLRIAGGLEDWVDQKEAVQKQSRLFRELLKKPTIRAILSKSSCPTAHRVERERPFAVRDGEHFLSGSIDRLVWSKDDSGQVCAEVIDYKTDVIPNEAVAERVLYYRPQLEAYQRAVSAMTGIPSERVTASLVFTELDRIERLSR